MNELTVNPTTGFLESKSNHGKNFTSEKKIKFLELARSYKEQTGKWPDVGSICDAVGVNLVTFYRHLDMDDVFKNEWEELTLRGEATLTSSMFELSTKNPMYMFGWLRRFYPQRWNPDHKVTITHDYQGINGALGEATKVIEAEIVEPSDLKSDNKDI